MVKVLRTFPTLVFRLRTPRSDSSLNVYNKRMMNFNDNCAKPMLNDQNRQLRLQADVAQSCKETSVFVLPTDLRRRQPPVKLAPVRLYDSPIVPRFVTSHRQPFHLWLTTIVRYIQPSAQFPFLNSSGFAKRDWERNSYRKLSLPLSSIWARRRRRSFSMGLWIQWPCGGEISRLNSLFCFRWSIANSATSSLFLTWPRFSSSARVPTKASSSFSGQMMNLTKKSASWELMACVKNIDLIPRETLFIEKCCKSSSFIFCRFNPVLLAILMDLRFGSPAMNQSKLNRTRRPHC